jgi:hypothetical protein
MFKRDEMMKQGSIEIEDIQIQISELNVEVGEIVQRLDSEIDPINGLQFSDLMKKFGYAKFSLNGQFYYFDIPLIENQDLNEEELGEDHGMDCLYPLKYILNVLVQFGSKIGPKMQRLENLRYRLSMLQN